MAITFYFTAQGGRTELPVNPEELRIRRQGGGARMEVVQLGEINILQDPKLASVEMEFLLPGNENYSFLAGNWSPPETYLSFFRGVMESKKPMRLAVSEFGVNLKVSVESMEEIRAAGDHESVRCRLSLLQYRPFGAETMRDGASSAASGGTRRESERTTPSTYTIKSGDTLWAIAQRELGSGSRYGEIASLNGIANPNLIYPGTVLRLPKGG